MWIRQLSFSFIVAHGKTLWPRIGGWLFNVVNGPSWKKDYGCCPQRSSNPRHRRVVLQRDDPMTNSVLVGVVNTTVSVSWWRRRDNNSISSVLVHCPFHRHRHHRQQPGCCCFRLQLNIVFYEYLLMSTFIYMKVQTVKMTDKKTNQTDKVKTQRQGKQHITYLQLRQLPTLAAN